MAPAFLLFITLLACGAPAFAQGTGEIWGRVSAVTGEILDGATVTASNIDTGANRETKTDGGGRFGFAALPSGRYQVTAVHEGFAGRRQDDIELQPGHRMQIELPLRRAAMPETIALNPTRRSWSRRARMPAVSWRKQRSRTCLLLDAVTCVSRSSYPP